MPGMIVLGPVNSINIDGYGNQISSRDGYSFISTQSGLMVSGTDGSNTHILRTNNNGQLIVASSNNSVELQDGYGNKVSSTGGALNVNATVTFPSDETVTVNNFPATQNIAGNVGLNAGSNNIGSINLNDGYGNQISSNQGSLNANITNSTLSVTQNTNPWVISGNVGINSGNNTIGFVELLDGYNNKISSTNGSLNVNASVVFPSTQFVELLDGYGNQISSTTGSLNVDVTNFPNTQAVTQSGVWNVGLNTGSNTIGFVELLDGYGNKIGSVGNSLNVNVTDGISITDPSIGLNNNAIPTSSTLIGGSDGNNLRPIKTGVDGTLLVDAYQGGNWNVGVNNFPATQAVTQSGVWGVGLNAGSNNIGYVNLNDGYSNHISSTFVNGFGNSLDAYIVNFPNVQNTLVTNFPTNQTVIQPSASLLNATIAPLTTTSTINTQIQDSYGGKITSYQSSVNTLPPADGYLGSGNITVQDTGTTTTVGYDNQSIYTGTPTAGSFVSFALNSYKTLHVYISGSFTGTIQGEFSTDGLIWIKQTGRIPGTSLTSSSYTAPVMVTIPASGKPFYRVRATTAITGTVSVKVEYSYNEIATYVLNALNLTDGTSSTLNTIKPASTSALTTDTSLVVALNPNSNFVALEDGYSNKISSTNGSLNVLSSGLYNNTTVIPLNVDGYGRLITAPASASSSISGFSFGDIVLASITTAAVERTTYTEQTTNFTGSINSSSANDTSSGTGARTITITYYDQTGAGPFTETATLNGTTAVNLVNNNHCFIEKIIVSSVGTGNSNAGTLTLFTGSGATGTTVATISVGDNQTFWAHHYVANGKTSYITGVSVGSTQAAANNGSSYVVKAKTLNVANVIESQVSDFLTLYGQSSMITRNYGTPIKVVGPARLRVYVTTLAGASATYRGAFDFYDQ